MVVDFAWTIGYFTRSAFTIENIGGSEFYRIFLSDHPLIYSEHRVSVERKSDLVRTSAIGYPGPVVRVGLRDGCLSSRAFIGVLDLFGTDVMLAREVGLPPGFEGHHVRVDIFIREGWSSRVHPFCAS